MNNVYLFRKVSECRIYLIFSCRLFNLKFLDFFTEYRKDQDFPAPDVENPLKSSHFDIECNVLIFIKANIHSSYQCYEKSFKRC